MLLNVSKRSITLSPMITYEHRGPRTFGIFDDDVTEFREHVIAHVKKLAPDWEEPREGSR